METCIITYVRMYIPYTTNCKSSEMYHILSHLKNHQMNNLIGAKIYSCETKIYFIFSPKAVSCGPLSHVY